MYQLMKQGPRGPSSLIHNGEEFVTMTELARRANRHLCHIARLVRQSRLGPGFKRGKIRYLPYRASLIDLLASPPHLKPWEK